MLLPLLDLLDIPPRNLRLIVDNARSPEHSVSFLKRRRRMMTRRSLSMDDSSPKNRWSSIVPLIPEDDGKKPSIPRPGCRRANSLDDFSQTGMLDKSSSPVKIPLRRRSPPSSPNDAKRQIITTSDSSSSLRCPVRRPSPNTAPKKSLNKLDKVATKTLNHNQDGKTTGNALISFPTVGLHQLSIDDEVRSSDGEKSPVIEPEEDEETIRRTNTTTAEYLSKALETVKVVD